MYGPPEGEKIARDAFLFGLISFILVGNTLIIEAYKKTLRLRTSSNVFIVSLAISDLLIGAIAVPLYLVTLREGYSVNHLLTKTFMSLDIFSGTASVFHLMSVTVDKYIAISKPFLHHRLPLKSYHFTLGVVWVLSILLSSLHFALTPRISKNFPLYTLSTVFLLALFVISLVNALIFKIAKSLIHSNVEPAGEANVTRANERRKIRREIKTASTLLVISGVFFITWLPHLLGAFVFTYCFPCNLALVNIARIGACIKCLQYSNSALNPFVYAFRDAEIRRAIRILIGSCRNLVQPRTRPSIVISSSLTQPR